MTIMLILHIITAILMTGLALRTSVYAVIRSSDSFSKYLLPSLAATTVTGLGLVAVSPHSFGQFCITMTVASVGVIAVHKFYSTRLQATL